LHLFCVLPGNILLTNNEFVGVIPNVFDSYTALEFFDVRGNQFSGSLPSTLFDVESLNIAYFSNNVFSGSIPANFANPPLLQELWLHRNQLTGEVPPIGSDQLLQITEMTVHLNNLVGEMPASICARREPPGALETLWADCRGEDPQILCDCCDRCFAG